MKLPAFVAALLGIISYSSHAAVSPVSAIHLSVEQHSSTKAANAKPGTTVTVTKPGKPVKSNLAQHRWLTIKLSSNSAEPFDNLVVKYFFIGHDMKDHKMVVLQQGQRKAALAPRGSETVESEEAVNTYTEAHSELVPAKGGKGKSKGKPTTKKIPASGKKVIGYAVQVLNGSKIEIEEYSEKSYREIAASAPSMDASLLPKPGDKKPAPKKAPKKK